MRTSRRAVAGVAILIAAALIQSASAAPCKGAIKGKVSGKAKSPSKGTFKGSVCWDGSTTKATIDWTVSTFINYRYSVIGNFSNLSPTTTKFAEILPAIGYVEKLVAAATAEELVASGTFPDLLAFAVTLCDPNTGVGIVIADPSTQALKVAASAKFELPKAIRDNPICKALGF